MIPWTDLISAIAPNGRDLQLRGHRRPRSAAGPVGVFKATVANAIFAAAQFATGPGQPVGEPFVPGRPMGFLAPPGTDPQADVISWVHAANAGEPYDDAEARAIVDLLDPLPLRLLRSDRATGRRRCSSAAASPTTSSPSTRSLRFANRTQRLYPRLPVSLLLGDFGHQRAANRSPPAQAAARARSALVRPAT